MHCFRCFGLTFSVGPSGRFEWHTSSTMPRQKWLRGLSAFRLSNAAFAIVGVNCLPPTPKRPPTTVTFCSMSFATAHTSSYSGSPYAASSRVLSSTQIFFTVFGSAAWKCFSENGLHRCTFITPTFSPC